MDGNEYASVDDPAILKMRPKRRHRKIFVYLRAVRFSKTNINFILYWYVFIQWSNCGKYFSAIISDNGLYDMNRYGKP